MNDLLTVAFVVALTAFFKARGFAEGRALLLSFAVAVFVGVAPLLAAMIPPAVPFVDVLIRILTLFLGASGSYDLFVDIRERS
jgi:hypothetical protein